MDASVTGLLLRFRRKSLHGLLVSASGHVLSDDEARAYLHWLAEHGYSYLSDAPDFDDVRYTIL
jgi:hypothetical protein